MNLVVRLFYCFLVLWTLGNLPMKKLKNIKQIKIFIKQKDILLSKIIVNIQQFSDFILKLSNRLLQCKIVNYAIFTNFVLYVFAKFSYDNLEFMSIEHYPFYV